MLKILEFDVGIPRLADRFKLSVNFQWESCRNDRKYGVKRAANSREGKGLFGHVENFGSEIGKLIDHEMRNDEGDFA